MFYNHKDPENLKITRYAFWPTMRPLWISFLSQNYLRWIRETNEQKESKKTHISCR